MDRESEQRSFDEMSIPEQIQHVQDLWDRIAQSSDGVGPTVVQREELERRVRDHESKPGSYSSWKEIRDRLGGETG